LVSQAQMGGGGKEPRERGLFGGRVHFWIARTVREKGQIAKGRKKGK